VVPWLHSTPGLWVPIILGVLDLLLKTGLDNLCHDVFTLSVNVTMLFFMTLKNQPKNYF
jgi:hypothetical protein